MKLFSKISSSLYAAAYFLCIPLFALWYQEISSDFFHSTVKMELSFKKDEAEVENIVKGAIIRRFAAKYGATSTKFGQWDFEVTRDLWVGDFREDDGYLSFNISGEGSVMTESAGMFSPPYSFRVAAKSLNYARYNTDPAPYWDYQVSLIKIDSKKKSFSLFELSDILPPVISTDESSTYLLLTEKEHQHVIDFLSYFKGSPTGDTGSFFRMLYFSTVTITTLGYGDIVPISDRARLVVAIESILGVLLMGLFVNSLFDEKQRR